MNKEEMLKNMQNFIDSIGENEPTPQFILNENEVKYAIKLEQENKQLKSKWLALETYIKDRIKKADNIYGYFEETLDVLKEIENVMVALENEKGE